MSKAFTRDDDDASFEAPEARVRASARRLTAHGARLIRDRLAELARGDGSVEERLTADRLRVLLEGADVVPAASGEHVALGARVTVGSDAGAARVVVIVTPDEVGIVPSAISAASPLGHALLGAEVGDTVELELPRGTEELTITALEWPA